MQRILFVLSTLPLYAGTYWASPTGAAVWASCESASPLSGSAACSLTTANSSALAGDIIYLRGGTYTTHIFPARSGTSTSTRIAYVAHTGETPVIRNTTSAYATYYNGIALIASSYIRIEGITVDNPTVDVPLGKARPLMITHGSSYNEISRCIIDGNGGGTIQMWDGDSVNVGPQPSVKHNWLHNNSIFDTGSVSAECDDIGGMQLGVPGHDKDSDYNTIESNVFYGGGHHNLETFTKYNVIQGNFFHHEGSMADPGGCANGPDSNGLYGNRNLQIYDGYSEDKYNLVEGNRFGRSGPPPDDDGGDGLTITAAKNIIRHNFVFDAQNNGVLFKTGTGSLADNNRFYNNTIYRSGRYQNAGALWQGLNFRWYGSYARVGNVIKNNILHSYGSGGGDWGGGSATIYADNSATNNLCTDAAAQCAATGNPLFVDPDLTDPTSQIIPNLGLQASSPAINGGTFLTQSNGAGSASTTLIVDDALYFQDGTFGSDLARGVTFFADWIAVGTVNNVVQISSVDYGTNTITLASPITWADNAPVWLYKKSDGAVVLVGSAPDYGASEYVNTAGTYGGTHTGGQQ